MSINTPSDTIILSVAQQNQLNLLERRLLNFQNEITIAKKEATELKAEIESKQKEKTYQEELLASLKEEVVRETGIVTNLREETRILSITLENSKTEYAQLAEKMLSESVLLEEERRMVLAEDQALLKKVEEFNTNLSKLSEDKATIEVAKEAFLKAIAAISWHD